MDAAEIAAKFEALEARLAELEGKAEAYDALVAAVEDAKPFARLAALEGKAPLPEPVTPKHAKGCACTTCRLIRIKAGHAAVPR